MIIPSKLLKDYINGFPSRKEACEFLSVNYDTLMAYLSAEQTCSSKFIESVKEKTGLDMEKAFEIKEDSDGKR